MKESTLIENRLLNISADYFQIYIHDISTHLNSLSITDWWAEEDHKILLSQKLENLLIVVGTFRDFLVPISAKYYSIEPELNNIEIWDQINEVSLYVPSKKIVIRSIFDKVTESPLFKVRSKNIRLRIYYGGKNTISKDGTEGDDNYLFHFWEESEINPLKIIKYMT